MPEVKKHIIQRSRKRKGMNKSLNKEIIFITQTEASARRTLFPKKLKKINNLLEKATLLPE